MVANRLYYGDNLDVLFKHKSGEDSQAQIEAFDDIWTWNYEAEEQYQQIINGGAPLEVADAMEAMRRLLGENDVLAYLVMMTARLVGGRPRPARAAAGRCIRKIDHEQSQILHTT
jgi:hypothetical protein